MTQNTGTTAPEDEFYEDAQDNFPSKWDFEDRLVAVWPTGKTGTRVGENGKEYPWIETITMALDDGPDGDKGEGLTGDREEFLVGPAPAHAEGIQWSAAGVYSRVRPKLGKTMLAEKKDEHGKVVTDRSGQAVMETVVDYRPVCGRINRRKNAKKGLADSWSLGKPTEEDRVILRAMADDIKKMTAKVKQDFEKSEDQAAFDE